MLTNGNLVTDVIYGDRPNGGILLSVIAPRMDFGRQCRACWPTTRCSRRATA